MTYRMLIAGRLTDGATTLDVINPATGETFEQCARADHSQLDEAVAAAKSAFGHWSSLSFKERGAYLCRFADAIEARADDIARLLTQEQGKPLPQSLWEIESSAECLRYTANLDLPEQILSSTADEHIVQRHVPFGVVAAIVPWNVPLFLLFQKVAPALVAGNTVVAKPAPTTPLTTLLCGELAMSIFPPGVFNTLVDCNDLGDALTAHPDVAKISFTGSTATGKKVMASAARSLKRVNLELGGNDPAIVLDDVDIATIAPQVFHAAMFNSGQICLAAKRVYVPAAIYDAFCDELARLARAAIVGDGLDAEVTIGPVQNRQQFDKLVGYLTQAHRHGRVIAGGHTLDRPGYFVAPTIVRDLPDDAPLVCEEQFGPILPVLRYDDIDEAISRANDSPFGLGATIWGKDLDRAKAVAARIDAGTVWINRYLSLPFDVPMGGTKQSGMGVLQGTEGLKEFTQIKIINMAL